MDKRTRELIKKIARMNHGFKDEKHGENESEDTMHENVPILIKEPFSLSDLIKLSEINGDPKGFERLTVNGYVHITWAKSETLRLKDDELECLMLYYERQYDTQIIVNNKIKKFKKIQVLGYTYESRLAGRQSAIYFNAYRCNDVDVDDLEGVDMVHQDEHLRAGAISFFFQHTAEFEEDGETFRLNHYFAFVEWYKNPRNGIEDLQSHTGETMRPFRKEFEKMGSYSILPVQKLYTPIHIERLPIQGIIVTADFPRRYI